MDGSIASDSNFIFAVLAGVIGMVVFAIVVVLFVVFYQRKMVRKQQELQLMETEHQKDLLNSTIKAQENERKRIAEDLHDGIGGLLSATKLYINQLKPESPSEKHSKIKQEASALLDETIGNIRTISQNLLPASLENLGLISAVEGLCKRFEKFISIELNYNQTPRFNNTKEVAIYRIIQELINNTIKHAEATEIYLSFIFTKEQISFIYKDDGKGFEFDSYPQSLKKHQGLGLKSIKSRVESIDGSVVYQSAPGKGVYIKVIVNPE